MSRPSIGMTTLSLSAAVALLTALPMLWGDQGRIGSFLTASFLLNALVVSPAIGVLAARKPVGLGLVHLVGVWFMLVLSPFSAFLSDNFAAYDFFSKSVDDGDYVVSNLLIFVWLIVFTLTYFGAEKKSHPGWRMPSIPLSLSAYWIQLSAGIVGMVYVAQQVGVGVLTRQAFEDAFSNSSTLEFLLYMGPLRSASIVALACAVVLLQSGTVQGAMRRLVLFSAIALGLAVAVVNNPLAAPRFYLGVVLLSFAFLFWFTAQRNSVAFLLTFLGGLIFLYPLDFGRVGMDLGSALEEVSYNPALAFQADTFRSYEAIPAALEYLDLRGATFGIQLFGNLLFWIPRSFWPDKPIGSGSHLAESFGESFTNIACPLPCEGLVNFGIIGVPLFAIAVGWISRRVDDWHNRSAGDQPTLARIVYPFFLGSMFFLTRGDLLSPVTFLSGFVLGALPAIAVSLALRKRSRPRNGSSRLLKPQQ